MDGQGSDKKKTMKRISFITTVDHNIGDDFVREGIKYLLRRYFSGQELIFENIHKHSPITVRHGFEWLRSDIFGKVIDKILPLGLTKDRVLDADIIVQSGAPVYWCHKIGGGHCAQNEWYTPLINRRCLKNEKTILLNLAAGTCQRYDSDGLEFRKCPVCSKYIQDFFNLCKVTTVRDALAKKVFNSIGLDAPLIPCSSIFAIDEYGWKDEHPEYVVVNYMREGGHYTFGQEIDFEKWHKDFKKFYYEIKKTERVIFSCHNQKEVDEAKSINQDAEIFYRPNDYLAYMKFYAKAKLGIVNRVHAAFLMASYGKPSIVIGNDSRAKMANEIGLKNVFVNDANSHYLMSQYEDIKDVIGNFGERFTEIKKKAYNNYMTALSVL